MNDFDNADWFMIGVRFGFGFMLVASAFLLVFGLASYTAMHNAIVALTSMSNHQFMPPP